MSAGGQKVQYSNTCTLNIQFNAKAGWEPLGRRRKREHFAALAQTGCWKTTAAEEWRVFSLLAKITGQTCVW